MSEDRSEAMPRAVLDATLASMRAAQVRDPNPPWRVRADRLRRLQTLIHEHRIEIADAIAADFGRRPREETELLELVPSLSGIRHALRHGRNWMRPRRQWADFWFLPARTELRPRPRGVVGIIAPWNYPLYLAAGPLCDALAAGNRVMLKPSEFTPHFSALLAECVARHFASEEITVVLGNAEVARSFASLAFDHLLFTGSTAVGREVMRGAADTLTPVTLELGGKSPAIVGPGARFDHAVERILLGKAFNAGQTCIAPDYALVPRSAVAGFVDKARDVMARFYPDLAANPQYASIASDRHFERLVRLRDEAVAAGASAHALAAGDDARRIFAPTLLTGVAASMAVMREEIFGPLLPIVEYDTLEDAIACVADRPRPLALYVFDDDRANVARVLDAIAAGGATVNDTIFHIAQHGLPFGGIGASGFGAYHGEAGFRTFSHLAPVLRQARFNLLGLLNPPYGRAFERLLAILLRR